MDLGSLCKFQTYIPTVWGSIFAHFCIVPGFLLSLSGSGQWKETDPYIGVHSIYTFYFHRDWIQASGGKIISQWERRSGKWCSRLVTEMPINIVLRRLWNQLKYSFLAMEGSSVFWPLNLMDMLFVKLCRTTKYLKAGWINLSADWRCSVIQVSSPSL